MFRKLKRLPGLVSWGVKQIVQVLRDYSLFAVLYFSQRMAEGFIAFALLFHLFGKNQKIEAAAVFSIWIALPSALKWAWAPLADRWGSRLGWILGATLVMAVTIFFLPMAEAAGFTVLMVVAVLNSFAVATQDLVTDAVAIDVLPKGKRWPVQLVMAFASKGGMTIGAGLALFLVRGKVRIPWEDVCNLIAGLVLVTGLLVFLFWKRLPAKEAKKSLANWRDFFSSFKDLTPWVLIFACLFAKAASSVTTPIVPGWFESLAQNFGKNWGPAIFTADTWLKLLGAVASGLLATKFFGNKRVLLAAVVLLGVSYASIGMFPGFWASKSMLSFQILSGSFAEGAMQMALFLLAMEIAGDSKACVTLFALFMGAGNASELWAKALTGWLAKGAETLSVDALASFHAKIFLLAGGLQLLMLIGLACVKLKGGEKK